jgi:OmpA-OmpF porin, OOP family
MSRGLLLVIGLILVALLTVVCSCEVERDILARSQEALDGAGFGWATADAHGRDVTLSGTTPSEGSGEAAVGLIEGLVGVLGVDSDYVQDAPAPPAPTAPEPVAEPDPAAEIADCEARLTALTNSETVQFASSMASLSLASHGLLDRVAALLGECPGTVVEIAAHSDSSGNPGFNLALSQRRAESVSQYLTRAGVDASRMSAVGYGDTKPKVDNATPAGRAENRRVEFSLSTK